MGEKLLQHKIAKDYNVVDQVDLNFQREDMFWAIVLYNVENQETENMKRKMPRS
jgi:hypothetical protein|tara:strand:- start:564 stop:725 length:162 start_codon:yes stop_codon:yes gene_type:complete